MDFLLFKKLLIILIVLFCRFSDVFCDDESDKDNESGEATSQNSDQTLTSTLKSEDSQITTTINSIQTSENSKETTTSNTEPNPENSKETTTSTSAQNDSGCAKHCRNSSGKKFQQSCVLMKYKTVETLKTKTECLEKCKSDGSCISATFIHPRSPTTLDLKTLYDKVIDSKTWVALKKPGPLVNYASEFGTDMSGENSQNYEEGPNGADINDEFQNPAILNISTINADFSGSCYLFDTHISAEQKLECSPSRLNFDYDQIDCFEDPNCVRPKKECQCGRCGSNCKEFNYISVPNACMANHYFGHLTVNSLESCLEFCLQTPGCKSVDFGNTESCLINFVDRNQTQLIMGCDEKNNELWDYYELLCDSECSNEKPKPDKSEDTCANIPGICKHGGNCETIQLPPPLQSFTYSCHCPCNWCGKHCEKLNMRTYKNGCLNSSVLAWSVAENSADCIDMCLNEINCKSVSYSATAGTCALHWADQTTQPLLSSSHCPIYRTDATENEWSFYQIICNSSSCHSEVEVIDAKQVKGCASNPCMNEGECADIFKRGKLIGYHCLCKCGYCGDRCETHNYETTENSCIWGSHLSDSPSDYYRKSVSLNICLDVCASKYPLCRSVDYSNKGECMLNKKDSDLAPITPKCNNYLRQRWNLYDLSCVCNNKPIIHSIF